MTVGDRLRTARRLGWIDPGRVAATATALARWGPTLASACAAAATRYPHRVAVVEHRASLTYAELDRRSTELANGFASLDLGDQEHLGVLCANNADFVEVSVAAAKAGLPVVYLNTGFGAPQLGEVLAREGVTALVADVDLLEVVDASAFRGKVLAADGAPPHRGHRSLADLRLLRASRRLRPTLPVAPVLLTSGTTGVPKGARRSARAVDPSAALALLEMIPYASGDITVIPTPLFHAWGLTQLSIAIGTASTSILVRRFDPAATLSAVHEHRATVLALVPVMIRRLLASEHLAATDTAALRIVASSGSALAAGAALEWMNRVGDTLYNLYGSTEVGQATIATPADLRAAPGTAGRVVPGISVEIVDSNGDAVAAGEQGRIMVGGRGQFSGYTGGGTKEVLRGLMATGDVGYFDRDQRLFVTGRADDMIVSGAENVYPQEVEDLLLTIDGVDDCAVAGVPDEEFGQRLTAWIVAAPNARLDPEEIRSLVARDLARHKVPRDIAFVDTLPRTNTGKLRRGALTDRS